ncbi:hypothetical protein CU044_2988 [Streptomyces sp. L-9-10]|nr:hypothetical protein CU044_2988 [Streptomyces sp. L-9-10]
MSGHSPRVPRVSLNPYLQNHIIRHRAGTRRPPREYLRQGQCGRGWGVTVGAALVPGTRTGAWSVEQSALSTALARTGGAGGADGTYRSGESGGGRRR